MTPLFKSIKCLIGSANFSTPTTYLRLRGFSAQWWCPICVSSGISIPPTAASVSLICGFSFFRCEETSAYPLDEGCECSWGASSCMACMATYLFSFSDLQKPGVWTIFEKMGKGRWKTYRNVPAENSNSIPVHHCPLSPSILPPPPRMCTSTQVTNAPNGAARLKIIRWPLAALFDKPCFSSTDVRPNAAGALWIMIATKMMNPNFVSEEEAEAPIAIPSAAAWITSPAVVARERVCLGVGVRDCRKESDSSSPELIEVEWRPWDRLSRLMCLVGGGACRFSEACRGSLSIRNMRIKPVIREKPM